VAAIKPASAPVLPAWKSQTEKRSTEKKQGDQRGTPEQKSGFGFSHALVHELGEMVLFSLKPKPQHFV